MSRTAALLLSVILIGLSVAPASGAPPDRRLEGTLQTIISEIPGVDGSQREFVALELPNGLVVELRVSASAKLPPPGSRVAVRGRDEGETFVAAEGGIETLGAVSEQTTMPKSSIKKVAVLMVNFVGDTRMPWTRSQVETSFFSDAPAKSVRSYFAEQSYGGMSLSGDIFGYYTIAADRSSCAWSTWHKQARDAATAAGVDLSGYTNVMAIWPGQTVCSWAGIAYVPGIYSALNNTISWTTASHELGHNFGAHHASSLRCTEAGSTVPISSTCSTSEYGDSFDRMGSGQVHFNHYHRRQVGFLSTADQLTASAAGSYTIGVASHVTSDGPKVVRIARGDGTYLYLEYRRPFGIFEAFSSSANVTTGVTLRIGPETLRKQTHLLDMSPSTTTFLDAALQTGQSFTDPASKATITTTEVGPTGATVWIAFPGSTPAPTASPTPTPTPAPIPVAPSPTPTPSPTATPRPTPTPSPTATPKPTPSPSATPAPTSSPVSVAPSPTPSPTTTPKPTASPSATPKPTASPSVTPTPTPTPPAAVPPKVVSSSPASGATNVPFSATPRVTFSEPVAGLSASSVTLVDTKSGMRVAGSVTYHSATRTATFSPARELRHNRTYHLALSDAIQDLDGSRLAPWSLRFTVAAASAERHAGPDRYASAAALSAASFSPGVPVVYVSTGVGFPDALAAGPAAAKLGGPVLLVERTRIPAVTAAELRRLRPGRIIVAGGSSVVASTVVSGLNAYAPWVTRQSGANRYATAAAVSAATFPSRVPVVYIATGGNYPDALAAGPATGLRGGPVLLVAANEIPAQTAAELRRLKPSRIVVAGGSSVVSNVVLNRLKVYAGTVTRQAGSDRYATAVAISVANHSPGVVPVVYLATARGFPDALSAAPVAGRDRGPVLLVGPNSLPASVASELRRLSPNRVIVVGGRATISDAVVRDALAAVGR